jgi:hypothetical protein
VSAGLDSALVGKLRDLLFERAVAGVVQVSDEDRRAAYRAGGLDRRLQARVAHIAVATREEAETLRVRLSAGEAFAELARQHSLDRRSAAQGGEIGVWRQGDVTGPMAEFFWSLVVGEVSPPVQEADGRFHLVTVLERGPVGYDGQREVVDNRARADRVSQRRAVFVDSLIAAYQVVVDEDRMQHLLRRGRLAVDRVPEAASDDSLAVLVRYRGGAVTLADYRVWLLATNPVQRRPYPVDRSQIADLVWLRTVTERLYPLEARARGLHRTPEIAAWARRKQEDLMVQALRQGAVEAAVLGEAAIVRYYGEHQEEYREPERVFVEGVLATSPEEAGRIQAECEPDGDLAAVAAAHPLPGGVSSYRAFSFTEQPNEYPPGESTALVEAARGLGDAPTGPTIARLTAGDGPTQYAVLRLVERQAARARPVSDPAVRDRIVQALRQNQTDEVDRAFAALVSELRAQHAQEIHRIAGTPGE